MLEGEQPAAAAADADDENDENAAADGIPAAAAQEDAAAAAAVEVAAERGDEEHAGVDYGYRNRGGGAQAVPESSVRGLLLEHSGLA